MNSKRSIRYDIGFRGVYGFVNVGEESDRTSLYNVIEDTNVETYAAYLGVTFIF